MGAIGHKDREENDDNPDLLEELGTSSSSVVPSMFHRALEPVHYTRNENSEESGDCWGWMILVSVKKYGLRIWHLYALNRRLLCQFAPGDRESLIQSQHHKMRTLIVGSVSASAKVYKILATIPYRHKTYSAVESVNLFIQNNKDGHKRNTAGNSPIVEYWKEKCKSLDRFQPFRKGTVALRSSQTYMVPIESGPIPGQRVSLSERRRYFEGSRSKMEIRAEAKKVEHYIDGRLFLPDIDKVRRKKGWIIIESADRVHFCGIIGPGPQGVVWENEGQKRSTGSKEGSMYAKERNMGESETATAVHVLPSALDARWLSPERAT
ncbi:hypothetical protein M413DRAFT_12518 [Hebeloma cylindrosporum]|uniref:Uncharacterized protein n=1 Tax=Hebeloma cylindrosporum TaxID=76867 RepID=A0A0C3C5L9_HEBCY|nr:hypothetical protein M413DRAFT_12518 [Hebeloma cylindrosporum h7]